MLEMELEKLERSSDTSTPLKRELLRTCEEIRDEGALKFNGAFDGGV